MMHFLLVLSIAGIVTSTMYAVLVVWGAVRFALRRRKFHPLLFQPPVSLLKPLHGLEPGLEAHLESFFLQEYPGYEIVFCARSDQDPALEVARRIAARHPEVPSKFLASGKPPYPNAKVWSLERMQNAADHQFLVVSDSDVSVSPGYLRQVMAPFADRKVGMVTCLYRGVPREADASKASGSFWSGLEAVGMSVEMSSGVLVAGLLEGMKFALGPTMVVRRDCLEAAGGFAVLGPYHADDFILGNLIAASGHEVVLSTYTIEHHVLNSSFLPSVRHQIRWMKSTRFSRPKGHLGTALTFGMPYAVLAAVLAAGLHRPILAALLLAWGWVTRAGLAALVGGLVVKEPRLLRSTLLYPLRDILGLFYWGASYLSNQVSWRGEAYKLSRDGIMRSDSQPSDHEREAVLTT